MDEREAAQDSDVRAQLPAIGKLLLRPDVAPMLATHGRLATTNALRESVETARTAGEAIDDEAAVLHASALLIERAKGTLVPVINATGVVLHTNLGRAELSASAIAAAGSIGAGACALEIDLPSGERGSRHLHAARRLRALTGAEDSLIANNAAAALLLAIASLAGRSPVIVSRGELIEIGGAFRIPEIIETGGATLLEVGTTNRTRADDYLRALRGLPSDPPPLLLKVHRSNFEMIGFTEETSLTELVAIARAHDSRIRVVHDLGSGLLVPGRSIGLPNEPDVPAAVRDGADVVVFSGDKLLGGPQAGLAVGRSSAIELMRRHPLMRAIRPGKLVLAALDATLAEYARDDVTRRLPALRKLTAPIAELEARAQRLASLIEGADVIPTIARVGAGAQPTAELASFAARFVADRVDALARALRVGDPAVVARVEDGSLLLDARTIDEHEVERVAIAVAAARSSI